MPYATLNGMGGTIALELAIRHPKRVRSLSLFGTWAEGEDPSADPRPRGTRRQSAVPAFSRALAGMIGKATLKIIPGGHGVTVEHWEDFNRAVLGFLRGVKR